MTNRVSPFVETNIDPLLAELSSSVELHHAGSEHPLRPALQHFIRSIFWRAHRADVLSFYPNLVGFSIGDRLRAVVGYRDGCNNRLFSEQYLDLPAHALASNHLGLAVKREQMVEVGNLAILDAGQARWVIAASTSFLAGAGYRWVLFTATRPLANAFHRLGLKPLRLGEADPARLPDLGTSWGSYYRTDPAVYVGDIHAGLDKLHRARGAQGSNLVSLLKSAHALGARFAPASEPYRPGLAAAEE
jgi:hypothetical protein